MLSAAGRVLVIHSAALSEFLIDAKRCFHADVEVQDCKLIKNVRLSRGLPFWPVAVTVLLLLVLCLWYQTQPHTWFNLPHVSQLQRQPGYDDVDTGRKRHTEAGADATWAWGSAFWGEGKQKVDEMQPDGNEPATPLERMGGWLPSLGQGGSGWGPFSRRRSGDAPRQQDSVWT